MGYNARSVSYTHLDVYKRQVGVSCVNALSTSLIATVSRNGKLYQQKYSKGKALADVDEIGTSDHTGTEVFFQPDDTIFQDLVYNLSLIHI